jgi:hypothetical protein
MFWMTILFACSTGGEISPEAKEALLKELLASPEFKQTVQ